MIIYQSRRLEDEVKTTVNFVQLKSQTMGIVIIELLSVIYLEGEIVNRPE
jgi:hypothetical protein